MKRFTWRRFSAMRATIYLAMLPVAWFAGWLRSVSFVSVLSVVALIESAVAAWRADAPNG